MASIKVGVNGFGAIGKRAAHAVFLQKDMKLVGVANRSVNINVRHMFGDRGPLKKADLYCSEPGNLNAMKSSSFKIRGSLENLLEKVDVIIDCTPAGIEARLKPLYQKHGIKQIYQGGADKSVADSSFTAVANYDECIGKESLRVVSCNTTSLVRTLHAVQSEIGIKDVLAVLVRRAADPPDDAEEGPINSIVPVTKIPSHHGPDVQTVMPHIDITTMACLVPVTLNHVHFINATLDKQISRDRIIEVFRKAGRTLLFRSSEGYKSSSQIAEMFRDVTRPRNDMYETCIWEDSVNIVKNRLYWSHAVHSEAIVIPETIDAIRAVMKADSKTNSMKKTNKSLCIDK